MPLIVYSGVNSSGRNITFGLSVVNSEDEATNAWSLSELFNLHNKLPNLCITDQDLALSAALRTQYPQITHLLCPWYITQNLKKHSSFLQHMNLKIVYNDIMTLSYIDKSEKFESEYEKLLKSLKNKKFNKAMEYLERVYSFKQKWVTYYVPAIFTAGIHTTSRIESVNAVIKNYVNSNSETCDLFDFVIVFEKRIAFKMSTDERKKGTEIHPVMIELRSLVSKYIFDMYYEQFLLSARYKIIDENVRNAKNPTADFFFRVKSIDSYDQNKDRRVNFVHKKYNCECLTYTQCGIVTSFMQLQLNKKKIFQA